MTNLTNIGSGTPVSLGGVGTTSAASGSTVAATLTLAADRLATTIAKELKLGDLDRSAQWQGGSAHDGYGLDDLAEALSNVLGGSPADRGALSRALHEFASEAASLLAARPQSCSFEKLEAAIAGAAGADGGASRDIQGAIAIIEGATRALTTR